MFSFHTNNATAAQQNIQRQQAATNATCAIHKELDTEAMIFPAISMS